MPAPATTPEFLEVMRRSGVVEDQRLDTYLERFHGETPLPPTPQEMADALVRDGLLTQFQAEQLLQGRCRRFTIANKYKLLERLGAGGMGSVYLCEHVFLRRRVAVKVLPASRADDRSALDRFYREARAVAALDHPNIVRAYDIDRDDQLHFLVMEYIDGSSLQEIIKKHSPMDILRACHYIRQAAEGLQHAHEAGWVHRDIKPGNLILDRTGTVKVLDLGLARFFYEDGGITKEHDETVLGTTDYLAPEQAIDGNVDIRADVYSLGATLYFLLTGRTPFTEGSTAQKLIWHQTRQPKPIRSVRPEVPEELAAVIHRMMAKDLNERYQTPAEVVAALVPWTQTPIPPPPEQEMPRLCPAARATGLPDGAPLSSSGSPGPRSRTWRVGPCTPGSRPRALTPQVIRAADPAVVIRGTPRPGPACGDSTPGTGVFDRNFPGTPNPASGIPMSDSKVIGPPFADTDEPSARLDTKKMGLRKEGDVVVVEQEVRSFGGHRQAFPRLVFSPDSRLALTGSMRTTVPLWNVETGQVIRRFAGHVDAVYAVAFAPDGRTAATGSFDRTVRIWDKDTGKEIRRILGHEKGVWAIAYLPEGDRIVSAGEDQVVRLWNADTCEIVRRFKGHTGAIHSVVASSDGRRLLTASRDGTARVWDVETGQLRAFSGHAGPVYCVAVSPDGTLAATGGRDHSVRLWEVETGAEVRILAGHTDQVTCVSISPDGQRVVTSSFDTTFRVWDAQTGKELFRFVGHRGPIVSLALSHDGTSILSGSMDQTIRLWTVPS